MCRQVPRIACYNNFEISQTVLKIQLNRQQGHMPRCVFLCKVDAEGKWHIPSVEHPTTSTVWQKRHQLTV